MGLRIISGTAGALAIALAVALGGDAAAAAAQAWPPFVLVTGLLLVGLAAHRDGLFEAIAAQLVRLPGSAVSFYLACLLLVAVVAALLNLDTAAVFLTPVLIHAAQRRRLAQAPFLYGSVFMVNAGSLLLPGSNLTNLLVLGHDRSAGAGYAGDILPAALAAALVTALALALGFRRRLDGPRTPSRAPTGAGAAGAAPAAAGAAPATTGAAVVHTGIAPASAGTAPIPAGTAPAPAVIDDDAGEAAPPLRALPLAGTLAAAVLTVALPRPALAVLALGVALTAILAVRGRLRATDVLGAINPAVLLGLFAASVALGTLARAWSGPADLLARAGVAGAAAIGALGAVLLNNLPAAVLFSAIPPAHPRALLIGLNLGPNLAITGSLSAVLWWQAARHAGATPSAWRVTRYGIVLAPLAIAAALLALAATGSPA